MNHLVDEIIISFMQSKWWHKKEVISWGTQFTSSAISNSLVCHITSLKAEVSDHWMIPSISHSLTHSITQSLTQSINPSTDQSIHQSVNQSTNQSISQSVSQSISQSVSQSVNQSIRQVGNSLINWLFSLVNALSAWFSNSIIRSLLVS